MVTFSLEWGKCKYTYGDYFFYIPDTASQFSLGPCLYPNGFFFFFSVYFLLGIFYLLKVKANFLMLSELHQ